MPKRAIFSVAYVKDPITREEIDIALSHADREYTEELNLEVVRTVFNTIQSLREPGMKLEILAREVVRQNVLESTNKQRACLGGVMKVYNTRKQLKAAADAKKEEEGIPLVPAVKQTQHPTEFFDDRQRILL